MLKQEHPSTKKGGEKMKLNKYVIVLVTKGKHL